MPYPDMYSISSISFSTGYNVEVLIEARPDTTPPTPPSEGRASPRIGSSSPSTMASGATRATAPANEAA